MPRTHGFKTNTQRARFLEFRAVFLPRAEHLVPDLGASPARRADASARNDATPGTLEGAPKDESKSEPPRASTPGGVSVLGVPTRTLNVKGNLRGTYLIIG